MFSPLSKYAGFYQELLTGTVKYTQLVNRLIQIGERAHSFRQFDMVGEVGLILSNIPIKEHQAIGWYFLAVAANSMGNGDQDEAKRLFELVVDKAPDSYKAKAIASLGAIAIRRNDFDSASNYFKESINAEKIGEAGLQAIRGMSILKSIEGFHKSAIADIERILPLVRFAPLKLRLDCLNSYAVELSEVGRLQEAENISSLVIASPLSRYYPEWQETLSDVRSKRKRRSTVTISRPSVEDELEAESEIVENKLQTARVRAVIHFMNANLHRRISVTELAETAGLSTSHLSRLFKLETGLSPVDYLIKQRMEKTRDLLVTSFLSIKQIMAAVGYDPGSRANFVSQFKRHFNLSPSEYRKRYFTGSIEGE
jgi:AraC-like DNA-binding protein